MPRLENGYNSALVKQHRFDNELSWLNARTSSNSARRRYHAPAHCQAQTR